MALNITPKAKSDHSNIPSRVDNRQTVQMGQKSTTTSRVDALKAKLTGQPLSQPMTKRPVGSTARRDEMSKLKKFTPDHTTKIPANSGMTSSRQENQDFSKMSPPPSGLAPGQELRQPPSSIESSQSTPEAKSEELSPQLVALTRKERQVRKAQQELKAAQDAWKQEQEKYIPRERLTSETLKVSQVFFDQLRQRGVLAWGR